MHITRQPNDKNIFKIDNWNKMLEFTYSNILFFTRERYCKTYKITQIVMVGTFGKNGK